VYYTG
ncbi:Thiamine-monophosphate kinase, partial [Haemophilus influenzae]